MVVQFDLLHNEHSVFALASSERVAVMLRFRVPRSVSEWYLSFAPCAHARDNKNYEFMMDSLSAPHSVVVRREKVRT